MKNLAIYGAGGLGREVACIISNINNKPDQEKWNFVGFFDDGKTKGEYVHNFGEILGGINELNEWNDELSIALCFGSPKTIKAIREKIFNPKISFPNIIDPDFSIGDPQSFNIGFGNIIKGHCSVTTNIKIGNFNLLNGYISIGHDVEIGNFNVFMPKVCISGEVSIGNKNLFGASSFIKQQIKIGNDITLSPLSSLLFKPKDGEIYIGNPAKKFNF